MSNSEQLFELYDLENELLVRIKLLVDDRRSDNFFKIHVSLTRGVDAWEQVT